MLLPMAKELWKKAENLPLSSRENPKRLTASLAAIDIEVCKALNANFDETQLYPLKIGTPTAYLPPNIIDASQKLPPSFDMSQPFLTDHFLLTKQIISQVEK